MKKFAADNLMCLRKLYPNIYSAIRNKSYDRNYIQIFESINKQANLKIISSEQRDVSLYSRYDPMAEAERWLRTVEDEYKGIQTVLFCGIGLGYHLKVFMDRFPDKRIYLYEPDPQILMAAIESVDLTKILTSKQIAGFAVGSDKNTQSQFITMILNSINNNIDYLVLPIYKRLFNSIINELQEVIQTTLRGYRSTILTTARFQYAWIENIVLNLEKVLKSYSFGLLKGVGNGIPAVIVGSGPSLEMEIDWLKKLKNRVIIIAAGSSVQGLLYHGIEPDLIVSMDPSDANYKVFEKLNINHIPFLFIPTIRHTILDRDWKYLLHAYLEDDLISKYFMGFDFDPIFKTTATVTGTAIQAAVYLQCSEVIFVGQDFSYPGGKHYTSGIEHLNQDYLKFRINNADELIENVNGSMNRTTPDMLVLKNGVEAIIENYKNIEFYNASRIGAVIRNTRPKTLDFLYKELINAESKEFVTLIEKRLKPYSMKKINDTIRKMNLAKRFIAKLSLIVNEITDLSTQSKQYKETDLKDIEQWFKKFDIKWNELIDHDFFSNVYIYMLSTQYTYVRRHWHDLKLEKDNFQKLRKLVEIIHPIIDGFHKVTPIFQANLDKALRRLNAAWDGETE